MEYHLGATSTCLRRLTAALMVLVVVVASVASSGPVLSSARGQEPVSEFIKKSTTKPKPCHRALLPGAVNTCPLAGFSFTSIPADEDIYAVPDSAAGSLSWRIINSRLLAQCSGAPPYRPPCLTA